MPCTEEVWIRNCEEQVFLENPIVTQLVSKLPAPRETWRSITVSTTFLQWWDKFSSLLPCTPFFYPIKIESTLNLRFSTGKALSSGLQCQVGRRKP
jgi:hypothetical protein